MSTTTNAPCVIDNGLERDTKIGLIVDCCNSWHCWF